MPRRPARKVEPPACAWRDTSTGLWVQEAAPDAPDGCAWWSDDAGCPGVACAHCDHVAHYAGWSLVQAWDALCSHCWHTHHMRRVWIDRLDQRSSSLVQLALPIVLDAEARVSAKVLREL